MPNFNYSVSKTSRHINNNDGVAEISEDILVDNNGYQDFYNRQSLFDNINQSENVVFESGNPSLRFGFPNMFETGFPGFYDPVYRNDIFPNTLSFPYHNNRILPPPSIPNQPAIKIKPQFVKSRETPRIMDIFASKDDNDNQNIKRKNKRRESDKSLKKAAKEKSEKSESSPRISNHKLKMNEKISEAVKKAASKNKSNKILRKHKSNKISEKESSKKSNKIPEKEDVKKSIKISANKSNKISEKESTKKSNKIPEKETVKKSYKIPEKEPIEISKNKSRKIHSRSLKTSHSKIPEHKSDIIMKKQDIMSQKLAQKISRDLERSKTVKKVKQN